MSETPSATENIRTDPMASPAATASEQLQLFKDIIRDLNIRIFDFKQMLSDEGDDALDRIAEKEEDAKTAISGERGIGEAAMGSEKVDAIAAIHAERDDALRLVKRLNPIDPGADDPTQDAHYNGPLMGHQIQG